MIEIPILDKIELCSNDDQEVQFSKSVLKDYWTCCMSREVSLMGRKEVLTGKAKFGIFGDGKELPQIALARVFREGDFRSGYYRDQTFMFASNLLTVRDFFSQLYADAVHDSHSGGRQMNAHFATSLIDDKGNWTDHTKLKNVSSDISSTAGQMARALGLAQASKKYRQLQNDAEQQFSVEGNEVSFVTIGDASTSEGAFWETINAACVMQVPLVTCVWDDGFGISVPKRLQTAKGSISSALSGFVTGSKEDSGIEIFKVKAWDYTALIEVFEKATRIARKLHRPILIHVEECTQPQGHSTSGSHERYKSQERLNWEREYDCILKFQDWIVETGIATQEQLEEIKEDAIAYARHEKEQSWNKYRIGVESIIDKLTSFINQVNEILPQSRLVQEVQQELKVAMDITESEVVALMRRLRFALSETHHPLIDEIDATIKKYLLNAEQVYHRHLYSHTTRSALRIPIIHPTYDVDAKSIPGYQLINAFFDHKLEVNDRLLAFGEDVGKIGDVNQGFAGLQDKYGEDRIFDVGIREWTIIGQAIGLAMRGLRPIAEIQYLDYLVYAMSPLTDDLATLRYRCNGIQMAPAIIRTRGHRLEGIWHSGSPLGMIISALRGIYVGVPRDMTRAVGMYNTLLQSDDPGLIIESLNGYRLREKMPSNIGKYTVPFGVPEIILEGTDITIVTYGSLVRIVEAAAEVLETKDISVEVIDAQTLLPFDLEKVCLASIKKTNRLLIVDEDVPGGASAYLLREILEEQKGYKYLDSQPETLTAKDHRTPYGSNGDYYTKPSLEDIIEKVYTILREANPSIYTYTF